MAKRLNKRFLTLLTLTVLGLMVGAVALTWWLKGGGAAEYVTRGDEHMEAAQRLEGQERYDRLNRAKVSYEKALSKARSDVNVWMKYAETMHQIVHYPDALPYLGKDMRAWQAVLEIDPRHVEAHRRLLEAWLDQVALRPNQGGFGFLEQRAKGLVAADPKDLHAKACQHIAVLGAWMSGKTTTEKVIEEQITALRDVARQKPDEADAVWYMSLACLRLAADRMTENDADGAAKLRQRARDFFEEAVKNAPEEPVLLFKYYALLARLEREGRGEPQDATRMVELISRANELIKPERREYVSIRLEQAELLMRNGKLEEAEQKLTALAQERDYDQQVRLLLATVWRMQQKRAQAIELLNRPQGDDPTLVGNRALLIRHLEMRRIVDLANLRLEGYAEAGESDKRALRERIEDGYKQAVDGFTAEDPSLLSLRGKMLLTFADGPKARYEAVHVLQKAFDKLEEQGMFNPELAYRLATTYQSLNQTGQAKALWGRLASRGPKYAAARKALVSLLLNERQFKEAATHVAELEKLTPQDPDVLRMKISVLGGLGQVDEAKRLASGLPQNDSKEKLAKAQALAALGETDAAAAMLEPLSDEELKGDAKDLSASELLAKTYLQAKKTQAAERLIAEVLAKRPADITWKYIDALSKGSVEDRRKLEEEAIRGIKDPTDRAVRMAQYLLGQNKRDEARAELAAAEKQSPNDGEILQTLFEVTVELGDLAAAQQYADRLAKLDWDQAGGLYYQTRLKLERKDVDGALRGAMELSRRVPELAKTWVLLGQAQQASGQTDVAIQSFGKAIDKQSENVFALKGLVECHWRMGQYAVAKQFIARGLNLSYGRHYFVQLERTVQEMDKRIKEIQNALSMTALREQERKDNPESSAAWLALANNYLRAADQLAGRNDKTKAAEYSQKARDLLNEALSKWPEEPEVSTRLADLMLREGKPAEGLALLRQLCERPKWKDKPEVYLLLAGYQQRLGAEGVAAAEVSYQTALGKANAEGARAIQNQIVDFYLRTQQAPKAISLLERMFDQTKDPAVRQRLIEAQVMARQHAEAEKALTAALKENAADAQLLMLLGFVKLQQGQFAEAEEQLNRAIKADPNHALSHFYLGKVKASQGDLAASITAFVAARDLAPRDAEIRATLADAYRRSRQLDEAAVELEQAVKHNPQSAELRLRLLRFYMDSARWIQMERLLADTQGMPDLSDDPRWWQVECQLWTARGELEKALAAIETARSMSPTADVIFTYVDLLVRLKRYDQVMKETDALVQSTPGVRPWWLHMHRGQAQAGLGQPGEALREFERALSQVDTLGEKAPYDADMAALALVNVMSSAAGRSKVVEFLSPRKELRWNIALAKTYQMEQDWPSAIRIVDELLEKHRDKLSEPSRMTLLLIAGIAHQAGGDPLKAEQAYMEYLKELEQRPLELSQQLEALNNLANLLAEHPVSPNPQKALHYSRRAFEAMTRANVFYPGVADTHGWVLVQCNRLDEGIEHLRTAASQNVPDAYYHLGEAYLLKSRPEEAQFNLEQARKLVKEYQDKQKLVDPKLPAKIEAAMQKVEKAKQTARSAAAGGQ